MPENQLPPHIHLFVERLAGLDPGKRAQLRRNAGRTLAEARDALGLFFRLLPAGVSDIDLDSYFLLATLYPLTDAGGHGTLGRALARARSSANAHGLDRRVEILLDADRAQLPFRLRQAVRFLRSNRVSVDWGQLLTDLLHWNAPSRSVQQAWARDYFTPPSPASQGEKGE